MYLGNSDLMKLDSAKVELSKFDVNRKVRIPNNLNNELCESYGTMLGDGYLGTYRNGRDYHLTISGNSSEDLDYLKYIAQSFKKLFNIEGKLSIIKRERRGKKNTELRLSFYSKALVNFYTKIFKFPIGKKKDIKIPKFIKNDQNFMKYVLRGLADTDFSLTFIRGKTSKYNSYPVIHAGFSEESLVKETTFMLNYIGIKSKYYQSKQIDKRNGKEYRSYHIF